MVVLQKLVTILENKVNLVQIFAKKERKLNNPSDINMYHAKSLV